MKKNYVFISHSVKDKEIAFRVCRIFEQNGVSCWIAPRDVTPGVRYPGEITNTIENCDAFILIFSCNSNRSIPVLAEIEMAFSKEIPIYTVKIDDTNPNPDLQYFLRIHQWHDVIASNFNEKIIELAGVVLKSVDDTDIGSKPEPEKQTISTIINQTIYPLAVALNDIKEQEINNNASGVDNAIFRLVDLLVKFSSVSLISTYSKLPEKEIDKNIDILLTGMTQANTGYWVKVLLHLAEKLKDKDHIPGFLREYIVFIKGSCENYENVKRAKDIICEGGKSFSLDSHDDSILSFIDLVVQFEKFYKFKGLRIKEGSKLIKDSILEIIVESGLFNNSHIAAVKSVIPNKTTKTFEHEIVRFKGLNPQKMDKPYITSGWEIIENSHVILFDLNKPEAYLDLFPFITAEEDLSDICIWEKSDNFNRVFYKRLGDKTLKEQEIADSEPFLKRLKFVSRSVLLGETGISIPYPGETVEDSIEKVLKVIDSTIEFIEKNVSNPLCKNDFMSKITSIKEQFLVISCKSHDTDFSSWIKKIYQLKTETTKGMFPKLLPTESEYILTDDQEGRYIIPDKFFDAHPEMIEKFEKISKILSKEPTKEVMVLLTLALSEVKSVNGQPLFGVEHLMIALSKICNKLIFDWYSAINIPPKYHRDLTRFAIETVAQLEPRQSRSSDIMLKSRLNTVLSMALKEANLAKRNQITLNDIFSAILREGNSLPLRILFEVFDLTSDRLLGEFYNLLRKS